VTLDSADVTRAPAYQHAKHGLCLIPESRALGGLRPPRADHGSARQERGRKHRADNERRTIPIPPELVWLVP
jgi:hypothetical protein